jgi:crotonobetainyl-CoA:carnitine CoA-transferase CaiB-like acyl-CoA transferase
VTECETRPEAEGADLAPPPLAGMVVLDMSRALAAPLCGMMLADLGATVIKVEDPNGGDQSRAWGTPIAGDVRTYFLASNRGKKSIAIDFSKPEGADLVRELAARSDVLVENFMRRSLPKYGLDHEALLKLNPRLVYCSISGYGRTGPMADRPGYDTVIQAESGLMSVTGETGGDPVKVGTPISDTIAGIYAAQAILAALLSRAATGRGQFIDISMLDCSVASLVSVGVNALLLGREAERFGNAHADVVPQNIYPTADGRIVVHIGTDVQFQRLCAVIDAPELATEERFATNWARRANREAIDQRLADIFQSRTSGEWIALLHGADLSAGLVNGVLDAVSAPEIAARGMILKVDHPTAGELRLLNSPIKLEGCRPPAPLPPPLLGEHTDEVLAGFLGLDPARIDRLRQIGVVA